jgi:hypothetical protein
MSPESPLIKASSVREQVKGALNNNVPLVLRVDTKTSSFLLGLPVVNLEQLSGKSIVIDGQKGSQTLLLNTTAENAKQLFISWSKNSDPEIQKSFIPYTYDHLYTFAQACHLGQAKQLAAGVHGLILDALAETGKPEYRFLEGMREYVQKKGGIEETDKEAFSRLLTSFWDKMDGPDRATRYEPRLAFQGR